MPFDIFAAYGASKAKTADQIANLRAAIEQRPSEGKINEQQAKVRELELLDKYLGLQDLVLSGQVSKEEIQDQFGSQSPEWKMVKNIGKNRIFKSSYENPALVARKQAEEERFNSLTYEQQLADFDNRIAYIDAQSKSTAPFEKAVEEAKAKILKEMNAHRGNYVNEAHFNESFAKQMAKAVSTAEREEKARIQKLESDKNKLLRDQETYQKTYQANLLIQQRQEALDRNINERSALLDELNASYSAAIDRAEQARAAEFARLQELYDNKQISNQDRQDGRTAATQARTEAVANAREQFQTLRTQVLEGSQVARDQIQQTFRTGYDELYPSSGKPPDKPPDTRTLAQKAEDYYREHQELLNLSAEQRKLIDEVANLPPIPAEKAPALTPEYYLSQSTVPRAQAEAEARRVLENYNIGVITDPQTGRPIDPVQYLADHAQIFGVGDIDRQLNAIYGAQGVNLGQYKTQTPTGQARQLPIDQATKIVDELFTTGNLQTTPETREAWINYFSNRGVDASIQELQKVVGKEYNLGSDYQLGVPINYQQGRAYTYDTSKDLVNLLFDTTGAKKSGYYDSGESADVVFSSWVVNSQYRPIEETIALWNQLNPHRAVNFGQQEIANSVQAILTKEAERQKTIQQQAQEQLRSQIDFITSGGLEQQPFQPSVPPLAPSVGGVLTTGTGQPIQHGFTPLFTPTQFQPEFQSQPFYPTQPGFQPQTPGTQPGFQPQTPGTQPGFQPQFQSPAATPLITQAQRPVLDQTVQFIESGGMSPTTGAQPMQPISYGELGAFTPQSQPYFTAPPLGYTTPAAEYAATGVVPMQEGGSVGLKAAAQQLASMGRGGDTMLAHITPQEAGLLKALGGSGTINPNTGLREYWVNVAMLAIMGLGTAMTIQEQRKQRKNFEAEQNRQRQERLQQLARGQAAYERSGLKDIPLESSPMRGGKVDPTTKFDPSMGGVRIGEGLPEIPIPRQDAQALQPPPAAPATPMMDEEERRRRGMAQGGMPTFEYGGTTAPTGEPRMVKGAGDGMSDNVPATIEGVQEARLANDEFVIPADVVADIGNGSSSAGARKLYEMMDRIREARHGTTEQPPEISAEKYMPS